MVNKNNLDFIRQYLSSYNIEYIVDESNNRIEIKTLEGWIEGVIRNVYLVKGIHDEFWLVHKDIFDETYEPSDVESENLHSLVPTIWDRIINWIVYNPIVKKALGL